MIKIVKVPDKDQGNQKAHDILKEIVDNQTLLALSGGTSPDYQKMIVQAADILPGAICVVDERHGDEFHENSNELLLKNSGVVDYCKRRRIEFYKILNDKSIEQTAKDYNQTIKRLLEKYPKRVGIMGVGVNLHTAGIFPYSNAAHSADFVVGETADDKFPQRITLTLRALGEFSTFIILVFGKDKKEALKILFDEGQNDMQKYPAIFYRKAPIKSYLITNLDI